MFPGFKKQKWTHLRHSLIARTNVRKETWIKIWIIKFNEKLPYHYLYNFLCNHEVTLETVESLRYQLITIIIHYSFSLLCPNRTETNINYWNLSVFGNKAKGVSQNGCNKKTKQAKFSKKQSFITPRGGKESGICNQWYVKDDQVVGNKTKRQISKRR